MRAPRRTPAVALLLGAFVLSVYLLTAAADLRHNGDTVFRYQTTQSIVENGHLWIAHPYGQDNRTVPGRGGHRYAFYAPGQSLLMIPLYQLGRLVAAGFALSPDLTTRYTTRSLDLLLGAVLAVALFYLALGLGYSRRVAVAVALILAFATPAWPDAQSALEQTQVNLFLLLAVFSSWRAARETRPTWSLVAAGAAVGAAVVTRYDALLYLPVIGLYPVLVRYVRLSARAAVRDLLLYTLAFLPFAAIDLLWNWARFGSPFTTGLQQRTIGEPPWLGAAGLLISPGKGLLWYMPLVFLVPFAVRPFYRRTGSFAFSLLAVALVPLAFYANVLYWHGDPSWGPRYLYTALPYLVLPLGELLSRWPRLPLPGRAAIAGLVGAGLILSVAAVSVTQWRFWYRLQARQQSTENLAAWTGAPFHWGPQAYSYYWTPRDSPILIQLDDLYQVVRLDVLGDRRYELQAQPDPWVSNPAVSYPVNTLNFWWADVRHPLADARARATLASLLLLLATAALAALLLLLRRPETAPAASTIPSGSPNRATC